ncbi:pre-tRNA nuclear export protein [Myotisia sp. PD_48]|nr:pre-tRNA nuclear export protein [Myotisia sp. PD_48]
MEEQVANAIEIAGNPSSDQALKAQAFDFLNRLRSDSSAWQPCLSIFTKFPRHPDIVRHVALEIVNSTTQSNLVDMQSLGFIKDNLMAYSQEMYSPSTNAQPDSANIQNKIAQTITYLFSALYTNTWPTFFDDMLRLTCKDSDSSTRDNALGTIFYLRVINSIHGEIGDVLVSRSRVEQDKANTLKDLIRDRDVEKLVASWQDILAQWQDQHNVITEMCLKAIGNWVSWINISLIVNQNMLDLLFHQLAKAKDLDVNGGGESVRDAAIDVFTEIVGKKMKPSDKVDMIVFLNLESIVSQLSASAPLQEYRFTSKYDTDLAETVAKLVNMTAFDIVKALDDPVDSTREKAEALLQGFIPHVLRYLSDEYDEICSTIIPCVNELLTFFRKEAKRSPALASKRNNIMLPLLKATVQKMRFDDTSTWGSEDDQLVEAEFQELRRRLGVLQQIIASTNEELYIEVVTDIIQSAFSNARQSQGNIDWRDLDLALHEMYHFGEIAVKSGSLYTKNKPNTRASERLIEMMASMLESNIRSFNHPATQLQYMEICVRYSTFFEHHAHLIPAVLESFIHLAHHQILKVRIRAWYLFQRLVRSLRTFIGNVAQTVMEAMGDLLTIRAEVPTDNSDGDDMSSEDNTEPTDTIFKSHLYLFEAVGIICSTASPVEKQVFYLQSIMNPIFVDMEKNLPAARNHDERATLQIHHDIMALGTLAAGYSDWMPGMSTPTIPPPSEVAEAFGQVSEATLVALESLKSSFNIRTAARSTFSRLIGVRGARNLPQLPLWIDGLLTPTSSKDEMALFLRLLDQIIFGFKGEIYAILDTLFTPFLQRVFAGIAEPITGTDDEVQLAELKREYLNFLLMILNNDLGSVIISNSNQSIFETVITTIEHFAKDAEDLPTAKMAFLVLARMSSLWGGPDLSQPSNDGVQAQPALPGFIEFMTSRFSPLCWAMPMNSSFNPKDAQAKQVLGEAAAMQKTIYLKAGLGYIQWLRDRELPGIGMGPDLINEYMYSLEQLDIKSFRLFFQSFIQRLSG